MASMPWGKHKGEDLEDIEASYLLWVLENCEIRPQLEQDLKDELGSRFAPPRRPREPSGDGKGARLPREHQALAEEIIKAGYRAVAQRVHPDHGGSHDEMVRAQGAMDALKAFVGRKG